MSKHRSPAGLQPFFREAGTWAEDRRAADARSRKLAWAVALIASTVAALEAIALAGMMPLKTVIPYTVLVDRQTGYVTTLDPAQPTRVGADSAFSRSMLAQYVVARETLDRATVAGEYRKVLLWSGEAARSSYLHQMDPNNLDNPIARLPQTTTVQASVKSVSLLEPGQALVRYNLIRSDGSGSQSSNAPYAAVIRFRFRDRPLAESDRLTNPLGFEVIRYRRDPEVPTAMSAAL